MNRQHQALSLARRKVIVRTLRDGRRQVEYRGKKLRWREPPGRSQRVRAKPAARKARGVQPPATEHPWRGFGMATGREYWRGVKARGKPGGAAA